MSIELKQAAQQAIDAIQDLRGYRPDIDKAIEALRTAIQQAEAKTDEPVAWLYEMLADTKEVFDANGTETPQVVRDVIEYVASWITVYNEKRHPATGVPDDVARDAERYRWLLCNYLKFHLPDEAWKHGSLDAAIDAAMLAAKEGGAA